MKKFAFALLVWLVFAVSHIRAQNLIIEPYTPGEGITVKSGRRYDTRFSGFAQPMLESKMYPAMDVGTNYTRFRMRRLVTKMTGEARKENITWQLQMDLTGSSDGGGDATTNNYLMDAWMAWQATNNLQLVVGQENAPTDNREMGMLSGALSLPDRSPVSLAFASIREFGAIANTSFKTGANGLLNPSFAITNGDGANVFSADHGGLKYGGRIDWLPFGKFANGGQYRQADMEREITPKFVFGINYSLNKGISDRRGRQSGTVLYRDSAGNESLPDYTKLGADFLLKYRGFSALGEFVKASATVPGNIYQRLRTDGSAASTFLVNGVQDVPAYVRGRIIAGWGLNMQAGYLFTNGYSVDARFARLVPETNSFLRNGTYYNRSNSYTICFTKYLGRNYGAKVQAAVTVTKAEPGSVTVLGVPQLGNEVSGLLMFTFTL